MPRSITISLPVTDVAVSKDFYAAIGFVVDPQFTDTSAAFLRLSEAIQLVLLSHAKWSEFTARPIAPRTSSEVSLMISCDSRDEVDAMNRAAAEHGGVGDINPVQDHGSMYGRDFTDPDGHVWGAMWVDHSAMPPG
jgi:predicted lactoylglutathione lyase